MLLETQQDTFEQAKLMLLGAYGSIGTDHNGVIVDDDQNYKSTRRVLRKKRSENRQHKLSRRKEGIV